MFELLFNNSSRSSDDAHALSLIGLAHSTQSDEHKQALGAASANMAVWARPLVASLQTKQFKARGKALVAAQLARYAFPLLTEKSLTSAQVKEAMKLIVDAVGRGAMRDECADGSMQVGSGVVSVLSSLFRVLLSGNAKHPEWQKAANNLLVKALDESKAKKLMQTLVSKRSKTFKTLPNDKGIDFGLFVVVFVGWFLLIG